MYHFLCCTAVTIIVPIQPLADIRNKASISNKPTFFHFNYWKWWYSRLRGDMIEAYKFCHVILLYLWSKCAAVIGSNRVTWCKLIWGIDRFTGSLVNKCRNLTGLPVNKCWKLTGKKTPGRTKPLRNQNHTFLRMYLVKTSNNKYKLNILLILKKRLFTFFIAK